MLEFAQNQQRVLVTLNRKHFIRLHRLHPDHLGIIVCTFDPNFVGLAQRIKAALESTGGTGQLARQLIRVNRPMS